MPNTYQLGQSLQVDAAVTNAAGNADSPDTVTWTTRAPDGTEANPTDTPGAAGAHQMTFNLSQDGTWYYKLEGDANPKVAAWQAVHVARSPFD